MQVADRIIRFIAGLAALGLLLFGVQFAWVYWGSGMDSETVFEHVETGRTVTDTHTVKDKVATLRTLDPPVDPEPADTAVIGRLRIPRLGLSWSPVIQEGVGKNVLRNLGAGHYPGTAMPGGVGNSAYAGHATYTDFAPLKNVRAGDSVYIQTPSTWYAYRVASTEIVPMDRTDVIQPHDTTSRDLTLTTCWPVMSPTPATHRLIIHAAWVGWAPVSDGTPAELAGVHETTADRTVRTVKTVARRLSMPVTQTMAASLALMWAVLDGLAWLIWHRRMRDVWRRPVADPLTCLFRLQAGPTAVRVVLFALMWAAAAFACFKWVCPALADAIPMFADPHPAV